MLSRCCFVFKQKTAYEMRISDCSSDVCSSDLVRLVLYVVERQGEDVPEPLQARHRSGRRPEVILAPVGDREFVPRPFVEYAPYAHLHFAGFLVTDPLTPPPHLLVLLSALGRVPLRLSVRIVALLHPVRAPEDS